MLGNLYSLGDKKDKKSTIHRCLLQLRVRMSLYKSSCQEEEEEEQQQQQQA